MQSLSYSTHDICHDRPMTFIIMVIFLQEGNSNRIEIALIICIFQSLPTGSLEPQTIENSSFLADLCDHHSLNWRDLII
jgi:hypothetical protein